LNVESFSLTFAIDVDMALGPGVIEPTIKRNSRGSLTFFPFTAVITSRA
jgi:hypothetical protein